MPCASSSAPGLPHENQLGLLVADPEDDLVAALVQAAAFAIADIFEILSSVSFSGASPGSGSGGAIGFALSFART